MKKSRKINRLKSRFVPVKFSLKEQRQFTEIINKDRKLVKDRAKNELLKIDRIMLRADLYCSGLGKLVFSESEMEAFSRFEKVRREFYHGK
jgi:hypothetical protein|nr:MAG TPA: hypothetical protein [Caudoviricetes sp.]